MSTRNLYVPPPSLETTVHINKQKDILLWRLVDLNKRFKAHLLEQSGKTVDLVVYILVTCLELKDDPGMFSNLSIFVLARSHLPANARSLARAAQPKTASSASYPTSSKPSPPTNHSVNHSTKPSGQLSLRGGVYQAVQLIS